MTDKIEMVYECLASAEMMIKIFTMRKDEFLKACFYGELKKKKDTGVWVIGKNESFTFQIENEDEIFNQMDNDDNNNKSYKLILKWNKKEWHNNISSMITMEFKNNDDLNKKCELQFKQDGIPNEDKYGNPHQGSLMYQFWENVVFKGLNV